MHDLSFLIPTYNDECLSLVEQIKSQADNINGLNYEIIVGDDGSTDNAVLTTNKKIGALASCRFIEREHNFGRAAMRNFLATEAQYEWVVFIDCNVTPCADFVRKYAECKTRSSVICGGVAIDGDYKRWKHNLRYMYEKSMAPSYTVLERNKHGHHSFRSSNFMIKKSIVLRAPFNEEITTYGYEDVLFGKQLKTFGFTIKNIDNPVTINHYESNERYVEKTEESLHTLKDFHKEVADYSSIIRFTDTIKKSGTLLGIAKFSFKLTRNMMRNNLCGNHPILLFYRLYKLGFYLSLHTHRHHKRRKSYNSEDMEGHSN